MTTPKLTQPRTQPRTRQVPSQPENRSRLLFGDVIRLGTTGLRSRPTRAVLSALGIAIGIAAMISVVGISSSSQARLNEQLASLGTNMLTSQAGKTLLGEETKLPPSTLTKLTRVENLESASSVAELSNINVYRNNLVEAGRTSGLRTAVADPQLLDVTGGTLSRGTWFNAATASYPTVVLGSKAATRLGVVSPGTKVWLGGTYFTVIGILDPVVLAPELDTTAFIGAKPATELFGFEGNPTTVYVRAAEQAVAQVRNLLPGTIAPDAPETVEVSRPSDALAAKNASDQAFTGLLVGLGSIALLVGGIGVANTMVISVLERRREIGLRRALGATRGHIRSQFLAEALLLSGLGGLMGALLGSGVTAVFALANGWPIALPPETILVGIGATLVIGAIAGLYPAIRAARTPPTAALSS